MIDTDRFAFMTTEDLMEELKARYAGIRDLMNDIEVLVNAYVSQKNLTAEEVAQFLRCNVTQIPLDMPSFPLGRKRVYPQSGLMSWIKSHTKSKKQEKDIWDKE